MSSVAVAIRDLHKSTAVNDALRANMLRGAGLQVVGPELAIMAGWGVLCFFVALRLFRWR